MKMREQILIDSLSVKPLHHEYDGFSVQSAGKRACFVIRPSVCGLGMLLFMLFVSQGVVAAEQCDRPWPVNIPQALETKEDLLSLQKKVKAYVQKAEAYLKCNEEEQSIVGSSDAEDKENKAIILHRYYNNTVDEMHYTADSFNKLVKAYKAAGAKPD